ncbi:MAG: hypothetical protein P8H90_01025 [Tateyamaria sp.]|nr:hypothetical protein [Tateyamaria sp.]
MDERDKHKAKASPEETQRYNDQIPKINNESAKIGEKAADEAITYTSAAGSHSPQSFHKLIYLSITVVTTAIVKHYTLEFLH